MDAETLNEHWDAIRIILQLHWQRLTDDELDNVDGNLDKLYGLMREKCGQRPNEIDCYLTRVYEQLTHKAPTGLEVEPHHTRRPASYTPKF